MFVFSEYRCIPQSIAKRGKVPDGEERPINSDKGCVCNGPTSYEVGLLLAASPGRRRAPPDNPPIPPAPRFYPDNIELIMAAKFA
jgi:hypothetical protein